MRSKKLGVTGGFLQGGYCTIPNIDRPPRASSTIIKPKDFRHEAIHFFFASLKQIQFRRHIVILADPLYMLYKPVFYFLNPAFAQRVFELCGSCCNAASVLPAGLTIEMAFSIYFGGPAAKSCHSSKASGVKASAPWNYLSPFLWPAITFHMLCRANRSHGRFEPNLFSLWRMAKAAKDGRISAARAAG